MTTDQNYQQIYRVGGMLDAGFVGQITYTVSLDQVYDELDIHFSFDKRLYSESDITPELIDRLQTLCTAKYNAPTYPVEEFRQTILHEMKTEIHTMAELNDNFIGCIHRQLTDRHMLYTKEFTSHLFRRFKSDRPCFQRAAGQHAVHADRFRTSGRTGCNRTEL